MPKVSVIIPNYNHARFLEKRISSVLSQTFHDIEIIIIDDHSTDESRSMIEKHRGDKLFAHIIYNEKNSGNTFLQWEKGMALAKGEYIWIAESDDFAEPVFLERALAAIERDKSHLFFSQSNMTDENDKVIRDFMWWTKDISRFDWNSAFTIDGKTFIKEALSKKNVIINASAVLFRKTAVDLSEVVKFKYCGDWLFWILYLYDKKLSYDPQKLNYFRSHELSTRNLDDINKKINRSIEDLAVKIKLKEKDPALISDESIVRALSGSIATTPLLHFSSWKKTAERYGIDKDLCSFGNFINKKYFRKNK